MVKLAYVDSSVLVKHYVESEKDSSQASRHITSYKVYASTIIQVEVLSALARKFQLKEILKEEVREIKDIFISDCQKIGFIDVSNNVIKEAQRLVFSSSIKTLDALHLSSAILLRRILETSFPIITADKKMIAVAEGEGFEVIEIGI